MYDAMNTSFLGRFSRSILIKSSPLAFCGIFSNRKKTSNLWSVTRYFSFSSEISSSMPAAPGYATKTTGLILKNAAILAALLFAFSFNQLFEAPRSVVGWAMVVVLSEEVKHWERHWFAYSVIFWATNLSDEDNFALIAVTTLGYGALIALSVLLPDGQYNAHHLKMLAASRFLTSIPVACNNLLFHPVVGIVRFAVFSLLLFSSAKNQRRTFTCIYILFAKSEALIPLIIWHVLLYCANERIVLHPELLAPNNDEIGDDNNGESQSQTRTEVV